MYKMLINVKDNLKQQGQNTKPLSVMQIFTKLLLQYFWSFQMLQERVSDTMM